MNVVVLGRPGSGKGTQSQRIESELGLRHLSTGELLRQAKRQNSPLGRQIAHCIDAGNFVSDELAMSLVEQSIQPGCPLGYVFDGIPRTAPQAYLLSELLSGRGAKIDLAILLDVSAATVRNRLLDRAKVAGRSDDTAETIDHRLAIYEAETVPVVAGYRELGVLRTIDGSGPPEEVFDLVQLALSDLTAGQPSLVEHKRKIVATDG